MRISDVNVHNEGYVDCKSSFYSCNDILSASERYNFCHGVNRLIGDIDSGIWAISYLMSMYGCAPKRDFVLFAPLEIVVNGFVLTLDQFTEYSCYMDKVYPLFSTKLSIINLVSKGLKKSKTGYSVEEIREIFKISEDRFQLPLKKVGNEIFKAMAAIGFANGKQVFCFPWQSKQRFSYYHQNLTDLLDTLEKLNCIVVLPIGR